MSFREIAMNIANNLLNAAFYFPDRCAVFEGHSEITFSQFNQVSSRVASALTGAGIQPGDHVALCAPNSFSWLAFYFGVIKAGAVAITFLHLLTKAEFHQIISDCRPKILFTIDEKLGQFEDINDASRPELVICDHGHISFDRFVEKGTSDFICSDRNRHETCAIL